MALGSRVNLLPLPKTKTTVYQNGENCEDLMRTYQQVVKVTDLQCEENKTGFNEENQYGLHWTLSPTQAESFPRGECVASPEIS